MRLECAFSSAPGKTFGILPGATFEDNFSGELDKGSIVLAQIPERLPIKPMDRVKVTSSDGFIDRIFLIDSFVEKRLSPKSGAPYQYEIDLTSETAILDKVAMPSRTITHPWGKEGKSIFHYIREYATFYSPWIREVGSDGIWNYRRMLSVPDSLKARFSAPCADMALQSPTLRQALSALMIQEGCIPVVRNGEIGYLDLRAEKGEFPEMAPDLSTQRAMAAAAYANTLVADEQSTLDDDGICYAEKIGFRSRENAILNATSDLKLKLSYPIRKVTRFAINAYSSDALVKISVEGRNRIPMGGTEAEISLTQLNEGGTWRYYLSVGPVPQGGQIYLDLRWASFVEDLGNTPWLRSTNGGSFQGTATAGANRFLLGAQGTPGDRGCNAWGEATAYYQGELVWRGKVFASDCVPDYTGSDPVGDIPFFVQAGDGLVGQYCPIALYVGRQATFVYTKDITPLCVERNRRGMLDADFTTLPSSGTLEEMAKWVYDTVGYDVGGDEIFGFSQTYEALKGIYAVRRGVTYLEGIIDFLFANFPSDPNGQELTSTGGVFGPNVESVSWKPTRPVNPFTDGGGGNYVNCYFDVEYVPFVRRAMEYSKKGVSLKLENAMGRSDGVASASQLEASYYDEAERIGREILSLHHRTEDPSLIAPLNSEFEGHLVFQRTVTCDFNSYDVAYQTAEDAVAKNYYVAVRNRYRSYAKVDYSEASRREERRKEYLLVSPEGRLPGGSAFRWYGCAPANLIDGAALPRPDRSLRMSYRSVGGKTYKAAIAVSAGGRSAAISTFDFDNESPGIYIDAEYYSDSGSGNRAAIGGVPQNWYEDYIGDSDRIGFSAALPSLTTPFSSSMDTVYSYAARVQSMPLIDGEDFRTSPATIEHRWEERYEKDQSEIMSFTAEWEAECPSGEVNWTSAAFAESTLLRKSDGPVGLLVRFDDFGNMQDSRRRPDGREEAIDVSGIVGSDSQSIVVYWGNLRALFPEREFASATFSLLYADGTVWDCMEFLAKDATSWSYFVSSGRLDGDTLYERDGGMFWERAIQG